MVTNYFPAALPGKEGKDQSEMATLAVLSASVFLQPLDKGL